MIWKKNLKPASLLVSQTELFSSNRTVSHEQKGTATCTCFSNFIFRRRIHPAWAVHAFLSRQSWVVEPASEHPRGSAEMASRSRKVPVLSKKSKQNELKIFRDNRWQGSALLSPGFGLLREASLRGWFSTV